MAKNYFLNQAKYLRQKAKFLNFMAMQIRKPENEGPFLGSNKKKNAGKEQGQD